MHLPLINTMHACISSVPVRIQVQTTAVCLSKVVGLKDMNLGLYIYQAYTVRP